MWTSTICKILTFSCIHWSKSKLAQSLKTWNFKNCSVVKCRIFVSIFHLFTFWEICNFGLWVCIADNLQIVKVSKTICNVFFLLLVQAGGDYLIVTTKAKVDTGQIYGDYTPAVSCIRSLLFPPIGSWVDNYWPMRIRGCDVITCRSLQTEVRPDTAVSPLCCPDITHNNYFMTHNNIGKTFCLKSYFHYTLIFSSGWPSKYSSPTKDFEQNKDRLRIASLDMLGRAKVIVINSTNLN